MILFVSNYPRFLHMYTHAHILFKKATALLLLAVMVYIHSAKLYHKHTGTERWAGTVEEGSIIATAKSACTVCDYHFTKDSDSDHAVITITHTKTYPQVAVGLRQTLVDGTARVLFLRGPPTCA